MRLLTRTTSLLKNEPYPIFRPTPRIPIDMKFTPPKKYHFIATLAAACISITGCATRYSPPPGSGTAELRITADQFFGALGGSIRVVYYRDGNCDKPEVLAVISKIHTTKSEVTVTLPAMPPEEADTSVDKIIETNSPANITLFSAKPGYVCSLPIAFKAEPNKAYRLYFYWDWSRMTCQANLALLDKINIKDAEKISVAKQTNSCKTGMELPAF